MKLGRKPAVFDPNVPHINSMMLTLPHLPKVNDLWKKVSQWPMLLNDQIGDCTIAGCGHIIEYWNVIGHKSYPTMTDDEALVQYEILGNYDPKAPLINGENPTDQGCVEADVLRYFSTHGIMAASQLIKLTKYVAVTPTDLFQIKTAIHVLGNCYFGYNLPSNALTRMDVWDVDPNATIEGGHCINAVGYDDTQNLLYIISWGQVVPVTYDFHTKYCEEAWALHSTDWV